MLPPEIRAITTNFYKFWTEQWQLHVSTRDAMDLTTALVNQSTRAFSVALECHVALANIQTRNKTLVDKLAFAKEKIKKLRAVAKAMKAKKIENIAKLDST